MTLFELAATLTLDTTEFRRGVGDASKAGQSLADTLGQKVTAKTIALGNAMYDLARKGANALLSLGKNAVQSAAQIAAENAQFEAAFGDIQQAARNTFRAIGNDTNILSRRLQNVGTKAFSQFKGAGLDAVDALALMDRYTRLAADAAAYYDISLEDADERLRSFLRGNTEAGDAIGLFTSESQRNTYALEQYGKKWAELNEAQRQMLMLNISEEIYKQSGAIDQAKREANNWTNTWANFQTRISETLAVLGAPFVDSLTPFVQNITDKLADETFLANLESVATKLGEIAGTSLEGVAAALDTLLTGEVDENSRLSKFVGSLQQLSGWVSENKTLVTAFFGSLGIALAATNLPLAALIAGIALLVLNWDTLTKGVDAAIDAVEDFFETKVAPAWQSTVEGAIETWNTVTGAISRAYNKLLAFFGLNSSGGSEIFSDHSAYKGGVNSAIGYGIGDSSGGTSASSIAFDQSAPLLNRLRGFATGLPYVPHDNFVARLHEGEAVLTKAEATSWRRGEGQGVDVSGIVSAVVQGVREGMRGLAINMDGQAVGDVVTDRVSQNIARAAWAGRYGG